MNQITRKVGKLTAENTAFLLCDLEEKFRHLKYFNEVLVVANRLISAAKLLEIPVVATEQYPKGLGHIVTELDMQGIKVFDKTLFSMATPELKEHLKTVRPTLESVVLFGNEAHICVQQTALDFLEQNIDVHVIADSTTSRTMTDRLIAFERIRQSGGFITTSESVLFQIMKDAKHPKFREVQKLVMESAPEQGLTSKY